MASSVLDKNKKVTLPTTSAPSTAVPTPPTSVPTSTAAPKVPTAGGSGNPGSGIVVPGGSAKPNAVSDAALNEHARYIQQTTGDLQGYITSQTQRYLDAIKTGNTDLVSRLQADAQRVGYQLPNEHYVYLENNGGAAPYISSQQQRYLQAIASGDADLAARLRADAQRVGYQLPDVQPKAQVPQTFEAPQQPSAGQQATGNMSTGFTQQTNQVIGQISAGISDIVRSAGDDTKTQALIASALEKMLAQISAAEANVLGRLRAQGQEADPALQQAIGMIRQEVDLYRRQLFEDMNARGVAQSGIMLEMEDRLNKNQLSQVERLISSRLSDIQNKINEAIMYFANMRMQALDKYNTLGIQSSMNAQDRLAQAQQWGAAMQANLAQMQNQNNQWQSQFDYNKVQDQFKNQMALDQFNWGKSQDIQQQNNWQQQFDFAKQQAGQQQANWQAQFDYGKALDAQQQSNWQQQFAANQAAQQNQNALGWANLDVEKERLAAQQKEIQNQQSSYLYNDIKALQSQLATGQLSPMEAQARLDSNPNLTPEDRILYQYVINAYKPPTTTSSAAPKVPVPDPTTMNLNQPFKNAWDYLNYLMRR